MEVQTKPLDLRLYLDLLFRNRWLVLVAVIIGGIAAGIVAYISPKIYESKSTVLVEDDDVLRTLTRSMAVAPSLTSKMQFLEQRLLTRDNLTQIARRLDLDLEARTPRELERLLNEMRGDIDVRASGRGQLIEIAFQHDEPTVARDVVAMLTDMLLEENLGSKRVEAHQAYDFISQQLEIYRTRLEESERRLREFKQKNLVEQGVAAAVSADGESDTPPVVVFGDVSRLAEHREQLSTLEVTLGQLKTQRAEFAKQLEQEPRWISAQQDYGAGMGVAVSENDQRIAALESRIEELRLSYTDRHPSIVQLQAQIEQLKEAQTGAGDAGSESDVDDLGDVGDQVLNPTYVSLKEKISSLDAQISSSTTELQQLHAKMVGLEKAILDVPRKEQELAALQRDYSVNRSSYNNLLKRLEEARVTKELEVQDKGGRIRVIEPATVPYKPVKPNRLLILLMGLGGGLAAGYGLGFLRHLMDNTVKSEDDVRGLVGLPVLGQIPTMITHNDRRRHRMTNLAFGAIASFAVLVFGGVLWLEFVGTGLYPIRAFLGV
jgi:polysaccharide chain length determinant protein (PEP-CTERM system associated)